MDTKKRNTSKSTSTTDVFQWTPEQIKKACDEHYYVKTNAEKSKQLLITGALGRWKKDANVNDIYCREVRLVGTPKSISTILLTNGLAQNEVDSYINNSYNKDNILTTLKDQFEKEVKECREYKKQLKRDNENNTQSIRVTDIVQKISPNKSGNMSFKKKTELHRDQTIVQKYNSRPEGRVMDVSSMRNDGSGIKNRDVEATKNRKGNVGKYAIVSSNVENYQIALRALGASEKEVEKLSKQFDGDKKEQPKKREKKKEDAKKDIPKMKQAKKPRVPKPPAKATPKSAPLKDLGSSKVSLTSSSVSPRTVVVEPEPAVVVVAPPAQVVTPVTAPVTVVTPVSAVPDVSKVRANLGRGARGFSRKSPGKV